MALADYADDDPDLADAAGAALSAPLHSSLNATRSIASSTTWRLSHPT